MGWWRLFLRTFTRGVRFLQHVVPDDNPQVWTRIQKLSRYVGYPAKLPPINIESEVYEGVLCEWLIPDTVDGDGVVLAIHGGANVFRWHAMHRHTYGWIAHWTKRRMVAPDFRVGAEHPYPAGIEDCICVYEALLDMGIAPEQICIAGDSSGGNIAAAMLLHLREKGLPMPAALELIAPVLDVTFRDDDPLTIHDPFTNLPFIKAQFTHYCKTTDPSSPMCSPVFADLEGFPPLRIDVGEDEILRNDAEWFARNAGQAQVQVEVKIWPEMWHGWYLYAPYLPDAKDAHQAIATFIRQHI